MHVDVGAGCWGIGRYEPREPGCGDDADYAEAFLGCCDGEVDGCERPATMFEIEVGTINDAATEFEVEIMDRVGSIKPGVIED